MVHQSDSDKYYSKYYNQVFNQGLLGKFMGVTHRFMERGLNENLCYGAVIELGAGDGSHKKYVLHHFKSYLETDIRKSENSEIVQANAESLSDYFDSSFDRVIATCLLAHLDNPFLALKEWRRIAKSDALISIYVPAEPGLILRLFRFFSTNLKARKMGIDHYSFHYREHRSYFINLKYLIYEVFCDDFVEESRFPFPFLSWNFNFFSVFQVIVKK